ncbi:MAG: sugar-binding protein [Armatimonadota bacterium]
MRYLHNTLSIAATLLALCPATSSVGAAPPAAETCPTVIVPVLSEAPNVDGGLSDAVWQRAARLGPFVNIAGGPAKNQTYARMLRCGPTLYVGFECGLAKGAELKVEQTSRDGDVWTDESVEVFIDPDLTFHKYRHFIVNAANVQRDESGDTFSAPSYDQGWDGTWRSATSRHAGAWYAELAIPFADLDLDDAAPAVIGLNVCRNDQTTGDATCWSPTKSGFHQPLRFGVASLPDEPLSAGVRLVADATAPAGLGRAEQKVTVQNVDDTTARLRGTLIVGDERTRTARPFKVPPLRPGDERTLSLPYKVRSPGLNAVLIAAKDSAGRTAASAKLAFVLPETFRREYGARIPGGEALGLWWAESLHKIHRDKPAPSAAR